MEKPTTETHRESRKHLAADRRGLEKRLLEPENASLLNSSITEILNTITSEITKHRDKIAEATGMCDRIAMVKLDATLIESLEQELAWHAAWAIHEGDSKQSVAKAMNKEPANLMRQSTKLGRNIKKIIEAYNHSDGHTPDEPGYDEYTVNLDDRSLVLKHPETPKEQQRQ